MGALLVLAIALAMDAFAVSVVRGAAEGHKASEGVRLGLVFGVAQGVMPLVGWLLGVAFADRFRAFDHWIAFTLLGILGARMIYEGLIGEEEHVAASLPRGRGPALTSLMVAAFATSIDAAAAGLTLPLMGVAIPIACFAIGAITAILCTGGYLIGSRVSARTGRWAEIGGGLVLIGIGARILVQHLSGVG